MKTNTSKTHITSQNSIDSTIKTIGEQATLLQDTASNPTHNVWVGASAGTGKTKVLTDRVLRLLLPPIGSDKTEGVAPSRILCITYTKAGAGEMIERIMKTLSQWAIYDDKDLKIALDKLFGEQVNDKQIQAARRLFAIVVDEPQGLTITTIHAFCQSLLGRFPLEANLSPQFKLIEDTESKSLIREARDGLIRDIRYEKTDNNIVHSFANMARWKNGDAINQLIQIIVNQQEKLLHLLERFESIDDLTKTIYKTLGLDPSATRETVLKDFLSDETYPSHKINILAEALSHGASGNQKKADGLKSFLAMSFDKKIKNYDPIYRRYFLTSKFETYSEREISKDAQKYDPCSFDLFFEETKRVQLCDDRLKAIAIAESTTSILNIAYTIIDRYNAVKAQKNVLDYNDLILKARDLLYAQTSSGRMMTDWVLYKIDGGIDHILVDEAQDTNPLQWQIIEKIAEEFFDGESAREHNPDRSIFVVGDEKQSIYRFQGAQPDIFDAVKTRLHDRILSAQRSWQDVPMGTSFRSVDAVLSFVDTIFNTDALRQSVTQTSASEIHHKAFRFGQSGRIELWPAYKTPTPKPREPWTLPIKEIVPLNAQTALAQRIASAIASWKKNNEMLVAKGRPIDYGDIMILPQRRNEFVDHLITALKSQNIPVSGVDRMIVSDQIAVQDLIAALSFALNPNDDLTLACLLKSPLVGWDDSQIEEFAFNRHPHSLWHQIKTQSNQGNLVQWLESLMARTGNISSFEAINHILVNPTPNKNRTGWQALLSRLGHECVDAIEELLSMAQNYDIQNGETAVQGFLHYIESDKRELKRELESGHNMVRIMTIHASKGLQAPIVILPDMARVPDNKSGNREDGFVWTNNAIPLWAKQSADKNDLYKSLDDAIRIEDMREYNRLLYVALTRAEDRLILCTHFNTNDIKGNSWYQTVADGFESLPQDNVTIEPWADDMEYIIQDDPCVRIFETPQLAAIKDKNKNQPIAQLSYDLPEWAIQTIQPDPTPLKTLTPSRIDDDQLPVRSPLNKNDQSHRFQRGLLTHSLLQYLPDMEPETRIQAGQLYLTKKGHGVSPKIQKDILNEVMNILSNPDFAPYFGIHSQAEVPITGKVGNDIISGQIDRMLVTNDAIWIVDFKSNRPPPKQAKDVAPIYKQQLAAYKSLIKTIYQGHSIRTALLWTDGPYMMEI